MKETKSGKSKQQGCSGPTPALFQVPSQVAISPGVIQSNPGSPKRAELKTKFWDGRSWQYLVKFAPDRCYWRSEQFLALAVMELPVSR